MGADNWCCSCGWRLTVPCGRDDCPHDSATHYATIARALDNAVANGCADQLARMSAEDIAYDLARLEAGCERLPIEILTAGVKAWLLPQSGRDAADLAKLPHWKRAEQLIADCELGPNCAICKTLRGLLDERPDEALSAASTPPSEQPGDSEVISELRATLAQVTAERDALSYELGLLQAIDSLLGPLPEARAKVAEEKVRALEAALREYGRHDCMCAIEHWWHLDPRQRERQIQPPCSCGLGAVLSPSPDTGEETPKG
jgi:hypothetical protein